MTPDLTRPKLIKAFGPNGKEGDKLPDNVMLPALRGMVGAQAVKKVGGVYRLTALGVLRIKGEYICADCGLVLDDDDMHTACMCKSCNQEYHRKLNKTRAGRHVVSQYSRREYAKALDDFYKVYDLHGCGWFELDDKFDYFRLESCIKELVNFQLEIHFQEARLRPWPTK